MSARVINSGVDTLVVSIDKGTDEKWFEVLDDLKEWARENSEEPVIKLGPEKAKISRSNWHRCKYQIVTADYNIGVSPSKNIPDIYAQINSGAIYSHGLEGAYKLLMLILEDVGNYGHVKGSRLDLFCDVQGVNFCLDDISRFSTRARRKRPEIDGEIVTSLNFGTFPMYLRIYNKTTEIRKKGGSEIKIVWRQSGLYNEDEDVWRIEFEMGREIFKHTGVDSVEELLENLRPLWLLLLTWCSLRVPSKNLQKSRWPVDPLWKMLEAVEFRGEAVPAVRQAKAEASLEKLIIGYGGYLSSIGKLVEEEDQAEVSSQANRLLDNYYDKRGHSFEKIVRQKMRLHLS